MNVQVISTLKQFYELMAHTRDVRFQAVQSILRRNDPGPDCLDSLKAVLACFQAMPHEGGQVVMTIDQVKRIKVDLSYEVAELKKDIIYLEKGEEALLQYLEDIHPGFRSETSKCIEKLQHLTFNCFITDRDGTVNNYCGRYQSSVQSIYNAIFLTRFAKKKTKNPVIVTSAPLQGPGLLDVSVMPEKTVVYAASKGREFVDLRGKRRAFPIESKKQRLMDELNRRIDLLAENQNYEKFFLIGSGFQKKFGQTTIARQDISGSASEEESRGFLRMVKRIVREIDPMNESLRIEDTGLDIEIILTVSHTSKGLSDFNKADGVRFLDKELGFRMAKGPHLVCGDTSSDLPLLEAALAKTPDTWAVFVTKDNNLAEKVRSLCSNSLIVPEPDILVTMLGSL